MTGYVYSKEELKSASLKMPKSNNKKRRTRFNFVVNDLKVLGVNTFFCKKLAKVCIWSLYSGKIYAFENWLVSFIYELFSKQHRSTSNRLIFYRDKNCKIKFWFTKSVYLQIF